MTHPLYRRSRAHSSNIVIQKLPARGVYILVLRLLKNEHLSIGSLSKRFFGKGYYAYIGSAKKGLRARVGRHLTTSKAKRWHIDWLSSLRTVNILLVAATSHVGIECQLASKLREEADGYAPRFGATDCSCPSHLYCFANFDDVMKVLLDLNLNIYSMN